MSLNIWPNHHADRPVWRPLLKGISRKNKKSAAVADDVAQKLRQKPSAKKSATISKKNNIEKQEPQRQSSKQNENWKQGSATSSKNKRNKKESKKISWWQYFTKRGQIAPALEDQRNVEKKPHLNPRYHTSEIKHRDKTPGAANFKYEKTHFVNELTSQILEKGDPGKIKKSNNIQTNSKRKETKDRPSWWHRLKNRSRVAPAPEVQQQPEKRFPFTSVPNPREVKGTPLEPTIETLKQQYFRINGGNNSHCGATPEEQKNSEKKFPTTSRQTAPLDVKGRAQMPPIKIPRQQQLKNLGGTTVQYQFTSTLKEPQLVEKGSRQTIAVKVKDAAPVHPNKPSRQPQFKTVGGAGIRGPPPPKPQQWPEKNYTSVVLPKKTVALKELASVPPIKSFRQQQFRNPGFPNPAMYCYMNSCLQSLLTLVNFVRDISRQELVWGNFTETTLLRSFLNISKFHFSIDVCQKTCLLSAFKSEVAQRNPEFTDLRQKDAHEFLMAILDQLRRLGKLVRKKAARIGKVYNCPVDDHMVFKMKNNRTCKSCGAKSERTESFTSLSLDLQPRATVKQLLDNYRSEIEVEFKCDCGASTSVQSSTFATLPRVLILQLKRFRFTSTFQVRKVHDDIILPRELHISSRQGASCYRLVSCISHMGDSAKSGHYICDGVDPDVSQMDPTERWFTYNDDIVTETCGGFVCKLREKYAYILFYQRQD